MSKEVANINPHQGVMVGVLSGSDAVVVETFPDVPAEKLLGHRDDLVVVYGEPGTFVDLKKRSEHLASALTAFSSRNQRLGFDEASNSPEYAGPIWAQYRENTAKVQKGADKNVVKFFDEARMNFWQATGFGPLRSLGTYSVRRCDATARKMWREFYDDFNAPNKIKVRKAYEKKLTDIVRYYNTILGIQEPNKGIDGGRASEAA